jgi:dimethylamine monooxygenase subunit A
MEISRDNIEQALHFRRERQTLRKLPESGDILFTIRTYSETFAEVVEQFPEFRRNIGSTIAGASPQTADYKGWAKILNDLQAWSKS